MSVRKRGGVYHYQFQIKNRTYYGTFEDAKSDAEARRLEKDEKAKVRLGLKQDKPIDADFCTFVNDVYLPYARENKSLMYMTNSAARFSQTTLLANDLAALPCWTWSVLSSTASLQRSVATIKNQHLPSCGVRSLFIRRSAYCLRSSTWPSFKRLRLNIRAGIFQKRCGRRFPCGKSGSVL